MSVRLAFTRRPFPRGAFLQRMPRGLCRAIFLFATAILTLLAVAGAVNEAAVENYATPRTPAAAEPFAGNDNASGTNLPFRLLSTGRRKPFSASPPFRPQIRELSPLVQQLLNESLRRWEEERNGTAERGLLLTVAQLFAKHTYLATSGRALPPNATIAAHSPFASSASPASPQPVLGFQLQCLGGNPRWIPSAVYHTNIAQSFLQIALPPDLSLNACPHSHCQTHCSYSVHGGVRVFARSCCSSSPLVASADAGDGWCRSEWILLQLIFFIVSVICICFCVLMIGLALFKLRRQQHDRSWALIEPFFGGAIILYAIPLLGWPLHVPWSCWLAVFGRQLGFILFYGSVLLKIYRNLQDYRVRKAQHVIVRELDLIIEWPQCPVEEFAVIFSLIELFVLLIGIRFCYKARNSNWTERYQFTLAIILEAVVSLVLNCIRFSFNEVGSRDALFLLSVLQLHLTISVNIATIITPKFMISSDSHRRALGDIAGMGSSGRAHPSLAKMRENLINGTIDFQEVPIIDMNPEDIRAELKRVYTQLRMYKLKNAYQDNPHISKRKGGGAVKKSAAGDATVSGRLSSGAGLSSAGLPKGVRGTEGYCAVKRNSIPREATPNAVAMTSPKQLHGADRPPPLVFMDEDKSGGDLTVESAPHNVHLLTSRLARGPPTIATPPVTSMGTDCSIRV
ncbi:hypothetical protein niasHT_007642 [Heterodera trifolii]|uniref:G-protein coupled receptors family 3 profile domain-containing protein n=1 Tax=Heterodera trifolii TaxID=157864 RepID=A0ABD2LQ16_9BILA